LAYALRSIGSTPVPGCVRTARLEQKRRNGLHSGRRLIEFRLADHSSRRSSAEAFRRQGNPSLIDGGINFRTVDYLDVSYPMKWNAGVPSARLPPAAINEGEYGRRPARANTPVQGAAISRMRRPEAGSSRVPPASGEWRGRSAAGGEMHRGRCSGVLRATSRPDPEGISNLHTGSLETCNGLRRRHRSIGSEKGAIVAMDPQDRSAVMAIGQSRPNFDHQHLIFGTGSDPAEWNELNRPQISAHAESGAAAFPPRQHPSGDHALAARWNRSLHPDSKILHLQVFSALTAVLCDQR